jgi:hypothetical protein
MNIVKSNTIITKQLQTKSLITQNNNEAPILTNEEKTEKIESPSEEKLKHSIFFSF